MPISIQVASGSLRANDEPTSTSINEKTVFAVRQSAPESVPVCDNTELLNALYGVIGALAALVLILVLTLVYLLWAGRRRKTDHEEMMMIPNGPQAF